MSFHMMRFISSAQTQIVLRLIHGHRVSQLAWIHLVGRVPDGFEFVKGLDEFRAKHFWQQRSARLTISMLAGKRTSMRQHNVGGIVEEAAIFADAFFALQVEIEAHVEAALAE